MSEPTTEQECPDDCGEHCGSTAWTRADHDARTDRLRPLADYLRTSHDVPDEDRRYRDTWLNIALIVAERERDLLDHLDARLDAIFTHYDLSPALYPTTGPEHPAHLRSEGALRASHLLRERCGEALADIRTRPGARP